MAAMVRKHRAPNGALRLDGGEEHVSWDAEVRKHRAPKGALRHPSTYLPGLILSGQKALSAKRCIKTCRLLSKLPEPTDEVRKHRAPKGALRRDRIFLAWL